ncbi:amidase [Natronobeatus ordinarius]|uniref:amidase n=1 Tax=Natronobeatus ordinarius TaxID=2963433 RepID=UPI0020CD1A88|nr:amidase family protein [Natronobeatus ordinarius]
MSFDIASSSATELAQQIRDGELSPVDVVDASLERITSQDDEVNAFITVIEEDAREAALEAETAVESGEELGPLHGVPVAVKDLLAMKAGVRHTFGSKLLEDFVAPMDSVLVRRIEQAGGIIVGKTNTPESGHKGHTDNKLVGATRNPFDPTKSVGGSSGGSAAALAAGYVPLAQGSDVGGSLRMPASMCNVATIKPTPGTVPIDMRPDAFVQFQPYLHTGPMARTVADVALFLDVLSGYFPYDPRSRPTDDADFLAATKRSIEGSTIGYTPDFDVFPVAESVSTVVDDAVGAFEAAGATVEETTVGIDYSVTELRDAWDANFTTFVAETAMQWKHEPFNVDFLGADDGDVEPELVEQIERGLEYSAVDLRMQQVVRTELFEAVQALFEEYDFLVMPTNTVPPFDVDLRLGPSDVDGEPIDPWLEWTLTWLFNQTPHPVVSVPAGLTDDGLPVGLQIVGQPYEDEAVLAAGAAFERERPWHDHYPA